MVFVFVFLIFGVGVAQAGLLSFISNIFAGEESNAAIYNSQNVPILQAPTAQDPKSAAVGGAVINIVENSSLLPVVGPLGSIADAETYKQDQISTYVVRDGDTLSKIAKMFGVSISTIYWANNLKSGGLVKPGDLLVILPISGLQHTVKKGDTIKSVAQKYKSDENEIIVFNNLPADGALEVGAIILIPDAEANIPSSSSSSGKTSVFRGGSGPAIDGYYARPIYGGRKTQGIHGYNGVDLADSCGTPVFASAGGTVIVARTQGWNGGYGKYVVIAHSNGTQTVYAHLSMVNVGIGQAVAQSYQVGSIGTTGNSTGCHLHFEVRGAKNPF